MDGISHIYRLARSAIKLDAETATADIECLIRLAKQQGDKTAERKLSSILIEARRKGLGAVRPEKEARGDRTRGEMVPSRRSVTNEAVSESRFLEDPLPAPLDRPFLSGENFEALFQYIDAAARGDAGNLLFTGPSGTGKTMTAAWLGAELGLPIYRLFLPRIFDSYLGKTARNLSKAFHEVASNGGILFLDEVDAVLRARNMGHDHGEMQRTVNILLMEMDQVEKRVPIIAATNLIDHLDHAVLRRFHSVLHFELPSTWQRERFLRRGLGPNPVPLMVDVLVFLTETFSFADLENLLKNLRGVVADWHSLVDIAQRCAPPSVQPRLREVTKSSVAEQACLLADHGMDKQDVASLLDISPALMTRWTSSRKERSGNG